MTSLSFKPRVPVFDANVKVGDAHDELSPCPDRAGLLAEMDTHGVQRAVIYHALADRTSPMDANRALENWLGDDGRLYPQWAAHPTRRSLEQIRGLHAQGRVSSVRLAGLDIVDFPFRPWSYDPLLSWLSQEGIPLWLALPEMDAHELVSHASGLPGSGDSPGGRPLHAYPLGPAHDEGAAPSLSRAEPLRTDRPVGRSGTDLRGQSGEKSWGSKRMIEGIRVIDFHGHVGSNDILGMVDDPDLMLHAMDACDIDVSCLFNIYYPSGPTGNDMTAQFVARHPDRFVGFAYVSPLTPAAAMVAELERAIDTLKLTAIKLYPPFVPWSLDQPQWDPIYEFADQRGLLIKGLSLTPKVLLRVAQGWRCEASYPGFPALCLSTLKALLPTRRLSAITPMG